MEIKKIMRDTAALAQGSGIRTKNITIAPTSSDDLELLTIPGKDEVWTPSNDISNFTFFIYGGEGVGKSSFSAMFPDTFHFFYEPSGKDLGGKNLAGYRREPKNWKEFIKYIELLEDLKASNNLIYKNIVIDVVDICFDHCMYNFLESKNLEVMPQDYGASWKVVEVIFREAIHRLANICGLILISHATEKSIEHFDGTKYDTMSPSIANKGNSVITKFCDMKGYYRINRSGDRELVIQPTTWCQAKNRLDSKFNYTNGNKINIIPMGKNKEESFSNFEKAFRNQLVEDTEGDVSNVTPPKQNNTPIKIGRKVN